MNQSQLVSLTDPVVFAKTFWPHVRLYKEQRQALRSFAWNVETYCPAGNMLGA